MRWIALVGVAVGVASWPVEAEAQLSNKAAPVVVSHFHLNVTSVDAHKRFWAGTLGGTATKMYGLDVVQFPDVLIFLRQQTPTGPTRGTAFDHIGFAVPDVPALTTQVVAAGYQLVTGREPAPGQEAAAAQGTQAPYGRFSYLVGPDGAKVELVTAAGPNAPPIAYHHIHFINKQHVEMQQWYMKVFDATLRSGQTDFFIGADLAGVGYSLNFFRWEGDQAVTHATTAGRVMDRAGFDVRNLEEFCKRLQAKGIALARPFRRQTPELGNLPTAAITDPWGTVIELTEGLAGR
jgi:predicted enzyme related to lactoylglutathione lyase/extradiol dioxygenase family protein